MADGGCAKNFLILLNALFFFAGGGLLGIGLWMKLDPMIVNYLHVVNINASDPLIDYAALIFIAVGAAALVISLIGCCGAIKGNQGLLFVYVILLLLLIAAEVVGGVLAVLYRAEVESTLLESMEDQFKNDYKPNTTEYDALNYMQVQLQCCGANNYTDYQNSYWWNNTRRSDKVQVPPQCCVQEEGADYLNPKPVDFLKCQEDALHMYVDSNDLNVQGCHDALQEWFQQHSMIMMILGFSVAGVQVLGCVCACSLRKTLKGRKYTA